MRCGRAETPRWAATAGSTWTTTTTDWIQMSRALSRAAAPTSSTARGTCDRPAHRVEPLHAASSMSAGTKGVEWNQRRLPTSSASLSPAVVVHNCRRTKSPYTRNTHHNALSSRLPSRPYTNTLDACTLLLYVHTSRTWPLTFAGADRPFVKCEGGLR